MKKSILFALILFSTKLLAENNESSLADSYFNVANSALTDQERASIEISQKWQSTNSENLKPASGYNGAVKFAFGSAQPSIICAVLQVCDVSLQPGEQVNSINLGDAVRWTIDPAISGSGENEVQHLIIKPLDVGLETTLVVTTDRRTYHFRLRSHRTDYMTHVSFTYPEDASAKWHKLKAREAKERAENTIPQTGEYLGNLNFNYTVHGNAPWKPLRVYNDGVKTIIQMPPKMSQTEAPTLLVVRRDGGLFKSPETVMVNYRVQGDRYIVDSLFDKAILIAGVGSNQDKITIQKGI